MVKSGLVREIFTKIDKVNSGRIPAGVRISAGYGNYGLLIFCLLSGRARDEVSERVFKELMSIAGTPRAMLKLTSRVIERTIYPVGFFRRKALYIRGLSRDIISKHRGRVPRDMDSLLNLDGVGRKTANLVLGLGFGIPAVCVDTHVHRVVNRLGWVSTKNPYRTERELETIVPKDLWISVNSLLVPFGRNICRPVRPKCPACPLNRNCLRKGVIVYGQQ